MEESTFQPTFTDNNSKKSPKRFILLAVVLLIILSLLFWFFKLMGSNKKTTQTTEITPTPTEYQYPTDTPTPSASKTEGTTPTPTSTSSINPVDKTTGLDRSQINVEIQNGSGVVGAAGKAADFLKGLGYKIASTGNADNYNYKDVTIQVKSLASKYMSLLKKDLLTDYTVGTTSADLSDSSTADALVIVGK